MYREKSLIQDALAAARLQEEEREQIQAARAAQAQADLNVARLLDSVSERTRQDVADLDRTAALADHEKGATFECPILFIECNKVLPFCFFSFAFFLSMLQIFALDISDKSCWWINEWW